MLYIQNIKGILAITNTQLLAHYIMKINQQYNGTIIGGIFTLSSLLLTLTFIVPIISVIPRAFIESIMYSKVNNEPYSNVGKQLFRHS